MLYETSITIPASTSSTSPTRQRLSISAGVITKIMVRPRPGHCGLAHCVILHHNTQVAPSTKGMSFFGDQFPIDWEEYIKVFQPPLELEVQGWNDDDTYEHTFDIFVAMLPREAIAALSLVDAIKSALSAISPKRIFSGGG